MNLPRKECCILNSGAGAWAFEPLANQLSAALEIDVSEKPRDFNYILHVEDHKVAQSCRSFIPFEAIQYASDKRSLATVFNENRIQTPHTALFNEFEDAKKFIRSNANKQWCLKYPTSCGANGHRSLCDSDSEPTNWPKPYVVQEFIPLAEPEVYRTYCAGGEIFGWVVRRFPKGTKTSPWVAHAQGARYENLHEPPTAAVKVAEPAFQATKLWNTFGCVDLICSPDKGWLVLEVGTDGLFNHVDREIGDPAFENILLQKIVKAFWQEAVRRR